MGKIFTALCNSREASMYGPIMGTSLYQVLADTLTLSQSGRGKGVEGADYIYHTSSTPSSLKATCNPAICIVFTKYNDFLHTTILVFRTHHSITELTLDYVYKSTHSSRNSRGAIKTKDKSLHRSNWPESFLEMLTATLQSSPFPTRIHKMQRFPLHKHLGPTIEKIL